MTLELDAERADRIVKAVAAGCSRTASAEAAGIGRSTLFKWLKLGRAGQAPFADLANRIKAAEGKAENKMVRIIRKAAIKQWQAAAWWLERRRPERYALKQKHQHEVRLTEEQARARFKELTGQDWPATEPS